MFWNRLFHGDRKNEENKLQNRLNDQTRETFSEADCNSEGEDHVEKLRRIMSEQDEAYSILANWDEPEA